MALESIAEMLERAKLLKLDKEIELAVLESNCVVAVEALLMDQRYCGVKEI